MWRVSLSRGGWLPGGARLARSAPFRIRCADMCQAPTYAFVAERALFMLKALQKAQNVCQLVRLVLMSTATPVRARKRTCKSFTKMYSDCSAACCACACWLPFVAVGAVMHGGQN